MIVINSFIIYSVLGYLFELLVALIFGDQLSSGILYGPYTPIYGIGILLLYSLFDKFKYIKSKVKKYIVMFLSAFVILTFLELLGGLLISNLYNMELWNYSKLPLSLNKYISLEVSTIWSIDIILLYKYFKSITDNLSKKIPKYISLIVLFLMFIDFIIFNINSINIR